MCLPGGGGGSPPAPPPDYTADKAQFAANKMAEYQTAADAYNTGVDAFNTNVSNAATNLSTGEDLFNSADIYDLYDDPNTTDVNEDALAGVRSDLSGFDFSSLDASSQDFGEAPIFNPVVKSPWGAVTLGEMPTLSTVNTTLGDDLYDRGQTLGANIDGLYSQRETAFDEFMGQGSAIEQAAAQLRNDVDRAGITSNLGGFENTLSDLGVDGRNLAMDEFYNQSRYGQNAETQTAYTTDIQNKINALDAARTAELNRIGTYESGLNDSANTYATEAAGLGITDMGRVAEIEAEIAALQRQAGQFNSELGFDFSQELGGFSDAANSLSGVTSDYNTEMDRVSDYEIQTRDDIRALRDSAFSTNMYDMGGLDALDQSLADFKQDAGYFSSDLVPAGSYDAELQPYYDTISGRSTTLRGDRKDALDALNNRIGGVTGGLGNIQLYNEDAFYDASSRLSDIGTELGRFSGGRVDDISSSIAGGQREVDTKIRELQAYRSKLEEDMIKYLEEIKTGDYYNFDDVATARDGVSGKESEVRLYRAKQAMDEITDMIAALDNQDKRLKSDASAAAARQEASRGGVGFGSSALSRNFSPMTASEYSAFVSGGAEEDPRYASNPSAFSSNLGVIRI